MKKFLSLVLALVMTMSLVTVSAGAKDFTDDSKITYGEAVDVMSAVGIIDGYSDGSFDPQATLTRGAAAKIICNLILGTTTASALRADTAPFKDVPANHVFAGYIAYCKQQKIINGYNDNTFRPSATLTSYAFMKMLLGALGYEGESEGYTGPNWSIAVAKQALAIGLDDGLTEEFNGIKFVTREEAMLYAFNTMQADLVEYDTKTTVVIDGVPVTVGGGEAKAMQWKNSATKRTNIKADAYVQFAEQYFPDLKKADTTDDFAQPATKWTVKGLKVGTYNDTPDATYTKNVTTGTIFTDLGMNQDDKSAEVFVNGKAASAVKVSKNNDRKIASTSANDEMVGDGSTVNVYYNDDTNDVTICVIDTFVGKITNVDKKAAAPFVNVNSESNMSTIYGFDGSFAPKYETEASFSEDDVVLFTYSVTADSIQSVKTAESVEGTVNKYTTGKNLTLGETTYAYNKNIAFGFGSESAMTTKNDYVVYLDANGLAIFVDEKQFNSNDFAFVLAVESSSQTGFKTDRAKLLTAEGKLLTVNTDDDYTNLGQTIVTYRKDANGDYVLRKAANVKTNAPITVTADAAINTDGLLSGGKKTFALKNTQAKVTIDTGVEYFANSETVFVVMQTNASGKTTYSVYTGIKNAPSIDSTAHEVEVAYTTRGTNVIGVMFIDATGATVTNGSKDVLFLASKNSVSKLVVDGDNNRYYVYNAVRDGEITTVKVSDTATGMTPGSDRANEVYTNVQTNNKDIITDVSGVDATYNTVSATGIWKLSGDYTVGLNAAKDRYTVASDAKMFRVDTDGNITKIDAVKDIYSDAKAEVIALLSKADGDLDYIFIQEVSTNPDDGASGGVVTNVKKVSASAGDLTVELTTAPAADTNVTVIVQVLNNGSWVDFATYTVTVRAGATSGSVTIGTLAGSTFRAVVGDRTFGL